MLSQQVGVFDSENTGVGNVNAVHKSQSCHLDVVLPPPLPDKKIVPWSHIRLALIPRGKNAGILRRG